MSHQAVGKQCGPLTSATRGGSVRWQVLDLPSAKALKVGKFSQTRDGGANRNGMVGLEGWIANNKMKMSLLTQW